MIRAERFRAWLEQQSFMILGIFSSNLVISYGHNTTEESRDTSPMTEGEPAVEMRV